MVVVSVASSCPAVVTENAGSEQEWNTHYVLVVANESMSIDTLSEEFYLPVETDR